MSYPTRPADGYPSFAIDGAATIVVPNLGMRDSGYVVGDVADEGVANYLARDAAAWLRVLDETRPGRELMGDDLTWKQPTVTYPTGAGFSKALGLGVVYREGRRLELDADHLANIGETNHVFAASVVTWVGINDERALNFVAGGPLLAGYTEIMRVTTDGAGVTAVSSSVPESIAGAESCYVGGAPHFLNPVHFGDDASIALGEPFQIRLRKSAAGQGVIYWVSNSLATWDLRLTATENLELHLYNGAQVDQGSRFALDWATGSVLLAGGVVADAVAGWSQVVVGNLGIENVGLNVLFNSAGLIGFTHTSGQLSGSIQYTAGDVLSLNIADGSAGYVFDVDGFIPDTSNTRTLGASGNEWSEVHAFETHTSSIESIAGALSLTGQDIEVRGNQSSLDFVHIRTHLGGEAGAFDTSGVWSPFSRVAITNTNGNEDVTLIPAAELPNQRVFKVKIEITAVENLTGTDVYHRELTQIYTRTTAGGLALVGTPRDNANTYNGWNASASATPLASGGNIILRCSNNATTVLHWIVEGQFTRLHHSD